MLRSIKYCISLNTMHRPRPIVGIIFGGLIWPLVPILSRPIDINPEILELILYFIIILLQMLISCKLH